MLLGSFKNSNRVSGNITSRSSGAADAARLTPALCVLMNVTITHKIMASATEFVIQGEDVDYFLRIHPMEYSGVLLDGEGDRIGEFKRKPFSLGKFDILVGEKEYSLRVNLISTTLVSLASGVTYRCRFSRSFKDALTKQIVTMLELVGLHMGCFYQHRLLVKDPRHAIALLLATCIQIHLESLG